MPIHFEYNRENDILYGSFEGDITLQEIRTALDNISHSDDFSPDVRALWDISKLDFTNVDSQFAEKIINMRKNTPSRTQTKIAIFAGSDLAFGMSRMYKTLSDGMPQHIMVFRSYAEAEKWLLGDSPVQTRVDVTADTD